MMPKEVKESKATFSRSTTNPCSQKSTFRDEKRVNSSKRCLKLSSCIRDFSCQFLELLESVELSLSEKKTKVKYPFETILRSFQKHFFRLHENNQCNNFSDRRFVCIFVSLVIVAERLSIEINIFRPHKWGTKIMICVAFFFQTLPKLHFISTPLSYLTIILVIILLVTILVKLLKYRNGAVGSACACQA